ncbi:uncharacterized protein YjiS (DUF1127 family) [Albidovulum inexpectatum]|uniref:Uncharacterized protein YjiS (DUF1127 family) n=1 Tax=Albidovulum inexpectatum TaxID=196587 RepID=A0A2S5JIE2_9RHOB|nr:DUF1127 domain-containing protein [Albidovulum inexpectatum]PPB81118.1 uncharacterized protein YjiS (DUF1127 family) [Albidovulum inexpectatum]
MAYSNTIRTADHGLIDQIRNLVSNLRDAHRRYKMYRQTVRELSALSDRELNDLGISRSSIRSIAIEAAYGK